MKSGSNISLKNKYRAIGVLFLMPSVIIYLLFVVLPFFDSFILSFQSWDGFGKREFVGLSNYISAFNDVTFIKAVKNSIYLGFMSSFFSVIVGLLLAWTMLYVGKKSGSVYRTILFSPSMIPGVITGLIFAFVFEPNMGVLNNFLEGIGLASLQKAWLTNKDTALNSILFVSAWKQVGLTMVLCYAGMQSLNQSLIESAKLDGAGEFKIFKDIILPLIMPFVQLSSIFALMSGIKIYDTVVTLTGGGPGKATIVMPIWILQNSFFFNKFGYGSAMSMIFVLVVLLGMILVKKIIKGESYEQ